MEEYPLKTIAELTKEDIMKMLREEEVPFKVVPTKSEVKLLFKTYKGDFKKLLRKRLKEMIKEELRDRKKDLK